MNCDVKGVRKFSESKSISMVVRSTEINFRSTDEVLFLFLYCKKKDVMKAVFSVDCEVLVR